MPRFVVLQHDYPTIHWDFMLEYGPALRTWRLERQPVFGGPVAAEPLPDHRLHYLDYVGPVSDNRGRVTRVDRGEYETLLETPSRLEVRLTGAQLKGRAVLTVGRDSSSWTFEAEGA